MLKKYFSTMLFCMVAVSFIIIFLNSTKAHAVNQLSRFADDGTIVPVNQITLDASSFDPSNEFYFRGFNVALFESNGTSYDIITPYKQLLGCGKILSIDMSQYPYQFDKAYKVGYRILYSISEDDHDFLVLNYNNGKQGWTPMKVNGKDLLLFMKDTEGENGLTGTYYENSSGQSIQKNNRIDAVVNFDWGNGAPEGVTTNNYFNVIWRGYVMPMFSGNYKFHVNSDDGMYFKISVNGMDVELKNWKTNTNFTDENVTSDINLVGGQKYEIELRYFENAGTAKVALSWSSEENGLAKNIIPSECLFPKNINPLDDAKIIKILTPLDSDPIQGGYIGDPLKYKFEGVANFDFIEPIIVLEKDLLDGVNKSGVQIKAYTDPNTNTLDKSKFKLYIDRGPDSILIDESCYTIEETEERILAKITDETVEFAAGDIFRLEYTVTTVFANAELYDNFSGGTLKIKNYISACKEKIVSPAGVEFIPTNGSPSPTFISVICNDEIVKDIIFKNRFVLD